MADEYVIRIHQHLAPVLQGFRRRRSLNQTEAGLRLGLTQRTYSALERHPERTSVARLLALLSVLNVELVLREKRRDVPLDRNGNPLEW
jgi:HTH-type transcriptional regulator/antitoxin HipB